MRHHSFGDGRHVLRLDPGEDVVGILRQVAQEQHITAGTLSGLGSVDEITLGFLDAVANEYTKRRFEERMEVAALSGSISMEEDRPHIHLHAVVAPREFLAYAGHVHEAKVGATLEIYITTLPAALRRVQVEGLAFPRLLLPGEPVPAPDKSGKPPPTPAKSVSRGPKKDGTGGR